MNVLFLLYDDYNNDLSYALVPSNKLEGIDLDRINKHSTQSSHKDIGDQVSMLFDRFGIEPFSPYVESGIEISNISELSNRPFVSQQDLKKYLNPDPSDILSVDKVVCIILN